MKSRHRGLKKSAIVDRNGEIKIRINNARTIKTRTIKIPKDDDPKNQSLNALGPNDRGLNNRNPINQDRNH